MRIVTGVFVGACIACVVGVGASAGFGDSAGGAAAGVPGTTEPPTDGTSAQADATITDREPTMAPVGDAYTFTLTIENETEERLDVTVTPDQAAGVECTLAVSPEQIEPNDKPTTLSVFAPKSCELTENKLTTSVAVGASEFEVVATTKAAIIPDWELLTRFRNVLIVGAVVAGVAFVVAAFARRFELTGLDPEWDFKEAWASNITVLGGILTGVIGSTTVLKAIVGEDVESALAVTLVAIAIAAAFVAAGPVVFSVCKRKGHPTSAGLILGGLFVATGAIGEVWIVGDVAKGLDKVTDRADSFIEAGMIGTFVLLGLYLVTTTWTALTHDAAGEVSWDNVEPSLLAAVIKANYPCRAPSDGEVRDAGGVVAAARSAAKDVWPADADPDVVAAILEASQCGDQPAGLTAGDVAAAIATAKAATKPAEEQEMRTVDGQILTTPRAVPGIRLRKAPPTGRLPRIGF